jgi:hypothetical protein
MGIEDDIRKQKEINEKVRRANEEKWRIFDWLKSNGFIGKGDTRAYVIEPPALLKPVISECLPHLTFTKPKFVKSMPGGKTYARKGGADIILD